MEGTTWFTALTRISHMFTTVQWVWYGHPSRNSRVMSFSQCRRKWMTLPQYVYIMVCIIQLLIVAGDPSQKKILTNIIISIISIHIPSKPLLLMVYSLSLFPFTSKSCENPTFPPRSPPPPCHNVPHLPDEIANCRRSCRSDSSLPGTSPGWDGAEVGKNLSK
jgi:hypothetical protein